MKYRPGDFSNNETLTVWSLIKNDEDCLEMTEELLGTGDCLQQLGFNVSDILGKLIQEKCRHNEFNRLEHVKWNEVAAYFLGEVLDRLG